MTVQVVAVPPGRGYFSQIEVTKALGIEIISGRYAEGSIIPREAELMIRFGVSRTVLRESTKTLAAKGLLSSKAHVGTWVRERAAWNMFDPDVLAWSLETGIDKRFLIDLADIRLAVEPRAAAFAAERRGDDDVDLLRQSIANMRAFASDSVEFADADLRLHLDVAVLSANPFMRSIGAVIEVALRASFRLSAPSTEPERENVIATHAAIVEAIATQEAETAAAAMTLAILNGLRRHRAVPSPIHGTP